MPELKDMWHCQTANCGFVYDPDRGDKRGKIPPGFPFVNLPETWRCPVCKASKRSFHCLADKQ